jgi:hypothetical protein
VEKGKKKFVLTGNFGYRRAFIGFVLRSRGYYRTKRVNKYTGFLIVGKDHARGPIWDGLAYQEAVRYSIPIVSIGEMDSRFESNIKKL